jgi:hypothetical protein
MGIANNRNAARSEAFTYDALNRVSTAWSIGNLWGEAYSIDPWGNLNQFGPYENSQNQIVPFVEANQSLAANTRSRPSGMTLLAGGAAFDVSAPRTGAPGQPRRLPPVWRRPHPRPPVFEQAHSNTNS